MIRILSEATISSTLPLSKEGILQVFNPRFRCSGLYHCFHCTGFFITGLWSSSINTVTCSSSTNTATCSPSINTATCSPSIITDPGLQVSSQLSGLQVSPLLPLYCIGHLTDISIESIHHQKFPPTYLPDRRKSSQIKDLSYRDGSISNQMQHLARSLRDGFVSNQMNDQTLQGHAELVLFQTR